VTHLQTLVLFTPEQWRNCAAGDLSEAVRERLVGFRREPQDGVERPDPCDCVGAATRLLALKACWTRIEPFQNIHNFWTELGVNATPDPLCPECGGTGIAMSSYNHLGRLDYWITLDGSDSEWLFPGDDPRRLPGGSARTMGDVLQEVDKGYPPAAIVTPDHHWVQCFNDKGPDTWRAEARSVLERHSDCIAVIVDCHC
jgi:hypothetical protein